MALSEARLEEIREEVRRLAPAPQGYKDIDVWWQAVVNDLLAEHDRLTAEVERLQPLAAVGEAVGRGIEIEPGDHCLRALSITHQREGEMDGAYRVFGYRVSGSGKIDTAGKRSGDGMTLEAALQAAGLMGEGNDANR